MIVLVKNLYYVQRGDTLSGIAEKFGTTIQELLEANIICNPNLIFINQVLIIPSPKIDLPTAGASPYYVILPGDTLYCLSRYFNTTVDILASINQIKDPNIILAGDEILIGTEIPDPESLMNKWAQTGDQFCDDMTPLMVHGIFYIGTLQWKALGKRAIPYLTRLSRHKCKVVRFYVAMSLGRIGLNKEANRVIRRLQNDPNRDIRKLTGFALRRIELVKKKSQRVHIMIRENAIYEQPIFDSPINPLRSGTEIIVKRWNIPSPIGEELGPGGLTIWDQVEIPETSQLGYIPRVGYNEISFI